MSEQDGHRLDRRQVSVMDTGWNRRQVSEQDGHRAGQMFKTRGVWCISKIPPKPENIYIYIYIACHLFTYLNQLLSEAMIAYFLNACGRDG